MRRAGRRPLPGREAGDSYGGRVTASAVSRFVAPQAPGPEAVRVRRGPLAAPAVCCSPTTRETQWQALSSGGGAPGSARGRAGPHRTRPTTRTGRPCASPPPVARAESAAARARHRRPAAMTPLGRPASRGFGRRCRLPYGSPARRGRARGSVRPAAPRSRPQGRRRPRAPVDALAPEPSAEPAPRLLGHRRSRGRSRRSAWAFSPAPAADRLGWRPQRIRRDEPLEAVSSGGQGTVGAAAPPARRTLLSVSGCTAPRRGCGW
ncbi:hypothetical protein HNR25_000128 [Streptomonospora salina]|uniref:Uncharacterized protein n=1 Tax=Streptomonospora salina TaxID=104205 RepID=A0A841DY74_9ACTN|nr:hypothetical protein [Streptomonospora salina]